MTDIEMEIDTSHFVDLSARADEDLIDFDSDMVDEHDVEWTKGAEAQIPAPTSKDATYDSEELVRDEENNAAVDKDEDIALEVNDAHKTPDNIDLGTNDDSYLIDTDHLDNEDGATLPEGLSMDDVTAPDNTDMENNLDHAADDEDHASTHEIDYELDDPPQGEEESHREVDLDVNRDLAANNSEVVPNSFVVNPEIQSAEVNFAENQNADDAQYTTHAELKGQDEITWDEEEGHELDENEEADKPKAIEAGVGVDGIDQPDNKAELEVEVESGTNDEEFSQEQEEELEETGQVAEEHDEDVNYTAASEEDEVEEERDDDLKATDPDPGEQSISETSFPEITVQYKGDEFPMFATATEGFFTETSVLDDTMETLLAQFREELTNEIAHEDELVFQVDELGLEFAESSLRDSLSSVTLRQILEIFDLLVKNQDPDSSRPLYTYLFTKPSTSKRLESLIESATAGKGLDEVIHLFESPMPNSTSVVEVSSVAHGFDELLDEIETPKDEIAEIHDGDLENGDEDAGEDKSGLGISLPDGSQINAANDQEDAVDDEVPKADELEEEVIIQANGPISDEAAMTDHVETYDQPESESNPFVDLELDENDEVDDEVDLENHEDAEEITATEIDATNVITATTSTTTTLQGDDETVVHNIDSNSTLQKSKESITLDDEDELAEIDWREEPETVQEAPDTPSGTGKRARTDDDEIGAEVEKDVKRRRP